MCDHDASLVDRRHSRLIEHKLDERKRKRAESGHHEGSRSRTADLCAHFLSLTPYAPASLMLLLHHSTLSLSTFHLKIVTFTLDQMLHK